MHEFMSGFSYCFENVYSGEVVVDLTVFRYRGVCLCMKKWQVWFVRFWE